MPDDDRRAGRQSSGPRRPYPSGSGSGHRAAAVPPALLQGAGQRRLTEFLLPAAVILAGVLLVVAFGFIINRAVNDGGAEAIPLPQPPALGQLPPPDDQAVIPLPSASVSSSASASPSPTTASPSPSATTSTPAPRATTPARPAQDLAIARGGVPGTVDLSGEGRRDWVHWGAEGTFSLERAEAGDFQILEGAPTAPRFRHALSPQRFRWQGGSPVSNSDGTPTGIRTCDKGNGFTLSAPASKTARTLKLYVGALGARGRLEARLSTGGGTEVAKLEQRDEALSTAVFEVTYRASKDGKLNLSWVTEETFGGDCSGVALQAATLR